MDVIEKIRQLVALMNEHDLAELEVEEADLRIKMRSAAQAPYPQAPVTVQQPIQVTAVQPTGEQPALEPQARNVLPCKEEALLEIASPMVGTFYRSSSESAEPYCTVGTVVEPDTVVCIVEAMKVMNEVTAEVTGEIVEILVQNAEPVEYGQVLFLVKPIDE